MPLAFCEATVLKGWIDKLTADACGFELEDAADLQRFHLCQSLREQGIRLACTHHAASWIVTECYKGRPPFRTDVAGFPVRKLIAREAATVLHRQAVLLTNATSDFHHAQELFLAHCVRGVKEAYAQFSDYIDAAVILDSQRESPITHLLADHSHLPYIVRKSGWRGIIVQM